MNVSTKYKGKLARRSLGGSLITRRTQVRCERQGGLAEQWVIRRSGSSGDERRGTMKISRRAFITSATASGIALSVSRLALAEEPGFAARETLPGRQAWNPAATGAGRIDGVAKVTGAKLYASDFRAADLPGWPMGATPFLMKRLPKVATEMALHVLAYNLTRVMNIMGIQPLMAAIQA